MLVGMAMPSLALPDPTLQSWERGRGQAHQRLVPLEFQLMCNEQ